MLRFNMLMALPVVLLVTGCPKVVENPAQAVSNAEITGNLTVFTYLMANKSDVKNAAKYLVAIETLEANINSKPTDGGFMALIDHMHGKLEERLTGTDAAFLPGAKSFTRILLLKMDQSLQLPPVEPSEEVKVLLDIVKAFLKGAKTALGDFIPN